MATRLKSAFIPNQIYFITFTILEWKELFTNDEYCNLVYKWFDYVKDNYQNKIHGYVIMPNHLHVLMYISEKSPPLSKLVQNAKRFLAYGIVRLLEKEMSESLSGDSSSPRQSLPSSPRQSLPSSPRQSLPLGDSDRGSPSLCSETLARLHILTLFKGHADVRKRAKHKVFKDRYDSKIIENEQLFFEKLNYIHNNPCHKKWSLVESPENYPYSSAANYILGKGIYEIDFVE